MLNGKNGKIKDEGEGREVGFMGWGGQITQVTTYNLQLHWKEGRKERLVDASATYQD